MARVKTLDTKRWQRQSGAGRRTTKRSILERAKPAQAEAPKAVEPAPMAQAPKAAPSTPPVKAKTPAAVKRMAPTTPGKNTAPKAKPERGSYNYVHPDVRPFLLQAFDALDEVNISGKKLAEAGAAVPSTIANWRKHRTRSPQLVTILGTLRACGRDLEVVKRKP